MEHRCPVCGARCDCTKIDCKHCYWDDQDGHYGGRVPVFIPDPPKVEEKKSYRYYDPREEER